ncbi:4-alpha-glucanotransferase [Bradyrhizobium sp. JYMT SZCCT0428]|uniref:4-alpha-glucanotransferase n=1 Tax=Bradyrhizobium sp. JYMT SZCCT0428 TaxID=2807673 RepID=UPI001BAB1416|nr:4-alpha-glucanotransferase [Bradyrhizobium sp. JYMT SZCCT0428]MBR1151910.1 4-alpha-glucanotransferase [Bradyrhizobium sp. JYMT SZCCT0428]
MDLFAQAASQGIQTEFVDGQGHRRVTDAAALKIILDALPPQTPGPFIGGPVVVRSGLPARTEISAAARLPVRWKIVADHKVIAEGEAVDRVIAWPLDLPLGVHRLQLTDAESTTEDVPLLSAPPRAFGGDFDRCWLLAVQLYGVRSARNWGIGDFTDLKGLIELANHLGADGVGLNPLHALFDDRPGDCSPYSPNSRLFLNALYVDVENIPEFRIGAETRDALARVREGEMIDYVAVAGLKWRALRSAFAAFEADATQRRRQEFEKFRAERGSLLSHFACFETLRHKFKKPWWEWPDEWRQPDDAKCAELRKGPDAAEIAFVEFVQWTADRQLAAAKDRALELGMRVGLYLDVAVGVQADGFDAWNEQVAISRHLGVGAPPDPLNTAGQSWGLAGFNATGLELKSFAPYREMLRASMRHAGAIRLDHVLGLKRLYLVPQGFSAADGVYVPMPFEALLAATAQESIAQRCVVIGEDLGTVPEGFRDQIAGWGIWSYLVMMFEREDHGPFKSLDHYLANALVTFNTHDLSTYAGWRSFGDLKTKRALGIDPGESDDARWHALAMLDDVLRHNGIDRNDLYSVANFLARTPSRLLAIALEDFLGLVDQPNIPGTVDEHPNWRRRLPVPLEQIASTIDVAALKAATRERSRG